MSSASDYLAIAAVFAIRGANSSLPRTRSDFIELLENRYNWKINDAVIEKTIRKLENWNFITRIHDKYAGETLSLFGARSDEALEYLTNIGYAELIGNARSGGVEWFKRVFSSQNFWEDFHNDEVLLGDTDLHANQREIDSRAENTDRVVTRTDERVTVDVIEADLRGLIDEISTNNEISIELGDEREIAIGELKAAETLVSQAAFRSSRLAQLALPILQFLAEKFAAGAIGELAKRLISAIMGLG